MGRWGATWSFYRKLIQPYVRGQVANLRAECARAEEGHFTRPDSKFSRLRATGNFGPASTEKRFDSGLRQSEVAKRLNASDRTLGVWECDRTYCACGKLPRRNIFIIGPSLNCECEKKAIFGRYRPPLVQKRNSVLPFLGSDCVFL